MEIVVAASQVVAAFEAGFAFPVEAAACAFDVVAAFDFVVAFVVGIVAFVIEKDEEP